MVSVSMSAKFAATALARTSGGGRLNGGFGSLRSRHPDADSCIFSGLAPTHVAVIADARDVIFGAASAIRRKNMIASKRALGATYVVQ
jgi:hypothetical protein